MVHTWCIDNQRASRGVLEQNGWSISVPSFKPPGERAPLPGNHLPTRIHPPQYLSITIPFQHGSKGFGICVSLNTALISGGTRDLPFSWHDGHMSITDSHEGLCNIAVSVKDPDIQYPVQSP